MYKHLTLVFLSLSFLFNSYQAKATTAKPLSIREATRQCEQDVNDLCIKSTCPTFCEASYPDQKRKILLDNCKNDCTASKLCQPKPLQITQSESALDAQNREQLMACIAQKRDPEGKLSGRRMEDWTTIQTPSWTKLINSKATQKN